MKYRQKIVLADKEKEVVLKYSNLVWKCISDIKHKFNFINVEDRDLFQEGMLVMMNNAHKHKEELSSFENFIYPQLKRELIRYIIADSRYNSYADIDNFDDDVAEVALYDIFEEENKDILEQLTDTQRQYFISYFKHNNKQTEIAKDFNVSKQNVNQKLTTIKKLLKKFIY